MVTRVDKKPIIYNTCLLRVIKPSVVASKRDTIEEFLLKSVGHAIPNVVPRDLVDDYEDIDATLRIFGVNDPSFSFRQDMLDEEEREAVDMARSMVRHGETLRSAMRSISCMESVAKVHKAMIKDVDRIYYGTEAVYALLNECRLGNVIMPTATYSQRKWVPETVKRFICVQAPYLFTHPSALVDLTATILKGVTDLVWPEWDKFKGVETIALRLFSRRNLLAHAHLYGINKKGFDPSSNPLDDFEIKLHASLGAKADVKVYSIMGIKYVVVKGNMYCLTADDSINLASMAQCFFRNALYFTPGNGYNNAKYRSAVALVDNILSHCVKLIDCKKNFSHAIRALHILAQGDFNDMYEEEMGTDLGWRDRSSNYVSEARALDPLAYSFHRRALLLARTEFDKLNVGFIYHCFVGDEMIIKDLRDKVVNMPKKVLNADKDEWANFIAFTKAYLICRYMIANKRKPKAAGDVTLLNSDWAERCVRGMFTMPPQSEWGKVWISKEFTYTKFADTWHLDAQDVSYVPKDTKGMVSGKYATNKFIHSELLMAMTSGNVLDVITGSTPSSARDRIISGRATTEVAITTAPKAENAKPSWKKRVTFAADCEFRKMQAEYDRNCRKVMGFIRGPSLGVDQCVLEKQFADIALATQSGSGGGICSHDISGWSESMDRDRKFEFEHVLIEMLNEPDMINIKLDWSKIRALVTKQGNKEIIPLDNGSFQGFDGSASTILHSLILIYCMDSARRAKVLDVSVKTNMATLIDDCIALMSGLDKKEEATNFWGHLKATYLKLGFIVDDLKSIFSTIKAIYLSRRFLCGAEVPADYKVFVKTHMSYEDPLRCALDAPSDIFGALRGACDGNGNAWFIYTCAVFSTLNEIIYYNPAIEKMAPSAAAAFALAPVVENGWGLPSMIDWATNDITDKRAHFNAIMESACNYSVSSPAFRAGFEVYSRDMGQAVMAIKSQAWRVVSLSNIFTNPFEAVREGPLKPDMLKRNTVQDMLRETATAEPWVSLLAWNGSHTTERVRSMLISSGPLHAPTLAALVNCMPDNYRLSLVGKAIGSQSLLDLLPKGTRSNLRRRVSKCSAAYFEYSASILKSTNEEYSASDFSALSYYERTKLERDEFYMANGCEMTDHTFPDPVGTFTNSRFDTGSFICPNTSSIIEWNRVTLEKGFPKDFYAPRGLYVPRKSSRVWEITSEYAKGWDTVSQRIAMGLAVLARAEADGHGVDGLLHYFVRAWNEVSNITPRDTHLMSIHGSIKRLDSNPGCSTHPIIVHRNILRGINLNLKSAIDAIPAELEKREGTSHNLHDHLAHECAMLTATALQLACFIHLGVADAGLRHCIATRPDCLVAESKLRMQTNVVADKICLEIMESEDNYGLLQACPDLAEQIAIPTMKYSWVTMISALVDGNDAAVEELRKVAHDTPLDELMEMLDSEEAIYTTSVIIAADPAMRSSIPARSLEKYALVPAEEDGRTRGDMYTLSVKPVASKFSRTLAQEQPDYLTAAVIIRSVCWERLKTRSLMGMSALYYDDPECSTDAVKECSSPTFWRAVVFEVAKANRKRLRSELLMQGFKSLGVPDIHLNASNSIDDLSHSIASFFGANLKKVVKLVSDQICSIAGRSSRDYEKPFLERVITNNPTVHNIRMRKEHMSNLIKFNIDQLKRRTEELAKKEPKHRGDKRALKIADSPKRRLVELRCRMYTYMATKVTERGDAEVQVDKLASIIRGCAVKVAERCSVDLKLIPECEESFEGILKFMEEMEEVFRKANDEADDEHKFNAGWHSVEGSIGARYAYDTIISDSKQVAHTKFAVSSSEVAPRLFKKIITVVPELPSTGVDDVLLDDWSDDDEEAILGFKSGGRSLSVAECNPDDLFGSVSKGKLEVNLKPWEMLYTLLYCGKYKRSDIPANLGIEIGDNPSTMDLRQSRIDNLTDEDINSAFPNLKGDYINSAMIFDPDWLERDEAAAYTIDEASRRVTGSHI